MHVLNSALVKFSKFPRGRDGSSTHAGSASDERAAAPARSLEQRLLTESDSESRLIVSRDCEICMHASPEWEMRALTCCARVSAKMLAKCLVVFAVACIVVSAVASLPLAGMALPLRAIATPALSGECEISWCSQLPKYTLPMSATWAAVGLSFSWVAPFKQRSGAELGRGQVILPATQRHLREDGRWEMLQVIANTYTPDGSPSCCCEYVSGPQDADFPITLSDYCVTPGVDDISQACSTSTLLKLACPPLNESAIQKWGVPYSEEYSKCDRNVFVRV